MRTDARIFYSLMQVCRHHNDLEATQPGISG